MAELWVDSAHMDFFDASRIVLLDSGGISQTCFPYSNTSDRYARAHMGEFFAELSQCSVSRRITYVEVCTTKEY